MKKILTLAFISALLLSGCNKFGESGDKRSSGLASITITLKSSNPSGKGRLAGDSSTNPAESAVSDFTVFVFNSDSGEKEAQQKFNVTDANYTGKINDLSTGTPKRVVVYVNVPDDMDLTAVQRYDDLKKNVLTLESQYAANIATTGLFMSGETATPLTLTTGQNNTVTIPVKRRVAKVVLKSLKVTPSEGAVLSELNLEGVSIQKARINSCPIGAIVAPDGAATANYAGGIASPAGADPNFALTKTYLKETITTAQITSGAELIGSTADEKYFYVLPNDNTNNQATMMAIYGQYGTIAQNAYYPFVINGTSSGQGGNATDGTYIRSNMVYQMSVTLSKINLYSPDPNTIPSQVVLDVTIDPQEWEGPIDQSVEW